MKPGTLHPVPNPCATLPAARYETDLTRENSPPNVCPPEAGAQVQVLPAAPTSGSVRRAGGIEFFRAWRVPVTRYRYGGTRIPTADSASIAGRPSGSIWYAARRPLTRLGQPILIGRPAA
jgi:hypothetical protein